MYPRTTMGSCAHCKRFRVETRCTRLRVGEVANKPHSSRHTARMWSALGLGKCSCQSSVMVRRRALALLLEHGVLGHESLSVCVL